MRGYRSHDSSAVRLGTDTRSVSEIYGSLLVISMAFMLALLLVGVGAMVLDEMESDTEDSLTQDAMVEMNDRLTDVSGSSVEATTTMQFPDGADVEAAPEDGAANVTIETTDEFWDDDEEDRVVNANQKINYTEIQLGTIFHESNSGVITAAQGGGVWEREDGHVSIVEPPGIDYRGNSLDLSFLSLTGNEVIHPGQEISASYDITTSEAMADEMATYLTYQQRIPGSSLQAGVFVNVTISSQFAEGWKQHATEVMQREPAAVLGPDDPGHDLGPDEVRLVFGPFGDSLEAIDDFDGFNPNICFAGLSQFATVVDTNCELTGNDDGFYVESNQPDHHEVAVFYQGRWVKYDIDPSDSDNNEWVGAFNENPVEEPEAVNAVEPGDPYYYEFEPNTPLCIVEGQSGIQGQLESGHCTEEMAGIDDTSHLEPEYSSYDVTDVEISSDVVAIGQDLQIDVTVENTGTEQNPPSPLAIVFDDTIVTGEEAIEQDPDTNDAEQTYQFTLAPEQTGEGEFIAATGDDSKASEPVEIVYPSEASSFVVDDLTVVDDDITPGDTLSVEADIENTGTVADEQYVQFAFENGDESLVAVKSVELDTEGEDASTTVEFDWTTGSGDVTADGTAIVRSEDSEETRGGIIIDGDTGDSDFRVGTIETNEPVTEGEALEVTAEIRNVEPQNPDTQEITLRNFEGLPVDVQEVHEPGDSWTDVELTWDTGHDVVDDGDNFVRDYISVETDDADREEEVRIDEAPDDQRDPFDVYMALDETGSMGFNFTHVGGDFQWEWANPWETVPEGETWHIFPHEAYEDEIERSGYFLQAGESPAEPVEVHKGLPGQDPDRQRLDAAASLIDQLDSDVDRVGAYQWDVEINTLSPLSSNFQQVKNSLEADPYDNTNTTRAIKHGIESFAEEAREDAEEAIVLLTDGRHTADNLGPLTQTFDEFDGRTVVEQAAKEDVTVHAVGLGPLVNDNELTQISDQTGGIYVHVSDPSDLEDAFDEIADELDPDSEEFEIAASDSPDEIEQGETVEVPATIENVGSDAGVQDVVLQVNNAIVDSHQVFIQEGGTAHVDLEWDTSGYAPGLRNVQVATADDLANEYVEIEGSEPDKSNFEVDIAESPDEVTTDESVDVMAYVNNTGAAKDEQIVWLEAYVGGDWQRVDVQEGVQLDAPGGMNETVVSLSWSDLSGIDPGEYPVRVGSDDDSSTPADVEVTEFVQEIMTEITDVETESGESVAAGETVPEGEYLDVHVHYQNMGDTAVEEYTVELRLDAADGPLIGVGEVTATPGEIDENTFTWDTSGYGISEYERTLISATGYDSSEFAVHIDPPEYESGTPFGEEDSINIDFSEIELEG